MFVGTYDRPTVVTLADGEPEFSIVWDDKTGLLRISTKMSGTIVANFMQRYEVKQVDWVTFWTPHVVASTTSKLFRTVRKLWARGS
ncbi:hypothetical protein LCGC14_1941340 [marine sediment metagenome]|uniref:Uncharacterized protein n=1 Tax=marine sediment metagenome TaxID=412755 RepID=A0A0F9FKI6_9ZZZZ